jgi:hypothetical protein
MLLSRITVIAEVSSDYSMSLATRLFSELDKDDKSCTEIKS